MVEQSLFSMYLSLVAQGVSKRSAFGALMIAGSIGKIDKIVFPKKPLVVHYWIKPFRRIHKDCAAMFVHPKKHKRVQCFYKVFAHKVAAALNGKDKIGIAVRGQPRILERFRDATRDDMAFALGAHEVRHRMQYRYKKRLMLFDRLCDPTTVVDPLVQYAVLYNQMIFESWEKHFAVEGKSQSEILRITNALEFDARVVETLVLHLATRCEKDLKYLRRVMWIQPDRRLPTR